jgi:ATP-dependent exoDNAse (exonuclease V) alpha subunit
MSDEQSQILHELLKFQKPIQTLGGYAGTGKTTLIRQLIKKVNNFAVCAFTGKAANVLRKKGVDASTIHSLIYKPSKNKDKYGNLKFVKVKSLDYDGIIVDEASMVNEKLYKDLLSFHLPIIFVGDHGQLEPIGGDINVMANPDFTLETIHRNAGEIAHFAEWVRKGYNAVAFANNYPIEKIKFINQFQINQHLLEVNQIICAFNKTRVEINNRVRQLKGYTSGNLVIGDRIMCLKNDHEIGLYNGMQGAIDYLYKKSHRMHFKTETKTFDVHYDPLQFGAKAYHSELHNMDDPHPFDWCYCCTVHKAQGDEWPKVMVIEQRSSQWNHARWAYTAASRAEEGIIWVA